MHTSSSIPSSDPSISNGCWACHSSCYNVWHVRTHDASSPLCYLRKGHPLLRWSPFVVGALSKTLATIVHTAHFLQLPFGSLLCYDIRSLIPISWLKEEFKRGIRFFSRSKRVKKMRWLPRESYLQTAHAEITQTLLYDLALIAQALALLREQPPTAFVAVDCTIHIYLFNL